MLRLRPHLTKHPQFEARLRAQTQILKSFHSPSFAPVHSVERLEETGDALAIVSSHVAGVRLSDVLNRGGQGRRPLSVDAALYIVRELTRALAALHSHASGLTHGALGPERVVLTAGGTVVVVEHAMGAALAEVGYDQLRFWTELGLGTVAGKAGATIDPRTDVLQIGLIAVSAILGRRLKTSDFPDGVGSLLSEVASVLNNQRLYPTEFVLSWLERTLQRSATASFRSAVDAAAALSEWCDVEKPASSNAPRAYLESGSQSSEISRSSERPLPRETWPFVLYRVLAVITGHVRLNRTWISISAVVASVAITLAFVGIPTAAVQVQGDGLATLDITTVPSGAIVRINGQRIGVTPLRHMLEPGAYELEVSKDGQTRKHKVALRSNIELNQYLELSRTQPEESARGDTPAPGLTDSALPLIPTAIKAPDGSRLGSLFVSSPVEVDVFREGRLIGVSGPEQISVPAGRVVLDLVNRELDFRTTTAINIQAGQQHTLSVTMPQGIVSVNAQPWAEVSIDGRRLGETPLGNIVLPIGRHQIVFQHPELGTVSRDVMVKPAGETRITVDLRR